MYVNKVLLPVIANDKLEHILDSLRTKPAETEVFEFKEANNNYDSTKIGKYFSALSNEANLKHHPHAWLIFGVEDKYRNIVGGQYRSNRAQLDSLKGEIANKTTDRITFIEIYEITVSGKRVIMFQIPAAPKGIPVRFDGQYYGRDGEEVSPLNIEEIERIRSGSIGEDWSAFIINDATLSDLDEEAIITARNNYKSKHPERAKDVDSWDDATFLNKAKITIKGNITNTAMLLLGKEESEHFINPAEAKIRWVLKDALGNEKDYLIVSCPLLLAVDKIYGKIRNLIYRYIKDESLFPDEVIQYEPYVIREAINNCIAHQDYTKHGRINVIESDDQLVFTNLGSFIPGTIEKVIQDDAPEERYRNHFLATAMSEMKMVDTIGSGIRRMFTFQRDRYFPLPEYDLTNNRVKVTITGKVLDMDYARVLARHPNLSLSEIILLDKVQKKKKLAEGEVKYLKSKNLIEGRKPNFYISLGVAKRTGQKSVYSKNKGLEKRFYLEFIEKALQQHTSMNREEINELLLEKLPSSMNNQQKLTKISNLLTELRKQGEINNLGTLKEPKWTLTDQAYARLKRN